MIEGKNLLCSGPFLIIRDTCHQFHPFPNDDFMIKLSVVVVVFANFGPSVDRLCASGVALLLFVVSPKGPECGEREDSVCPLH